MEKRTPDQPTLEDLTPEDCLALLAQHRVGRLAVAVPGSSPLVVPVNYVMDNRAVVFRTDHGEKLASLHGQPVSFQIDEIDPLHRTGWSVLVRGVAHEATHWEVDHLTVDPWAPGRRDRWVRVVPSTISGKRISVAPYESEPRAYL